MASTIRDVARLADVSVATVSRVLNQVATVDQVLAQRVNSAMVELGYVPNSVGRALRLQQSNSWAVIAQSPNEFFNDVVVAVAREAEHSRTSVYLSLTGHDVERQNRYLQNALSHRVSGLIVSSPAAFEPFRSFPLPAVFVDDGSDLVEHDVVSVDHAAIGTLAAQHLADRGYQRVACITADLPGHPMRVRSQAFEEEASARGLAIVREVVCDSAVSLADGQAAMLSVLSIPEPPDAVYCTNGPLTHGAYLGMLAAGVHTALLGTDDEDWTSLATPSITVIGQPVDQIGKVAARLLQARIKGSADPAKHIALDPLLIERHSTSRR